MPMLATKVIGSNKYFSLISFNINGLNSPIKRHRLTVWLHKQNPTFSCLQETHLREKDRHYLRMKGWKTIFRANGTKKQAGIAILISNKIDLNPKLSKKTRRGTSYSSKLKSSKRNSQFCISMLQILGQPHSLKKL
jgi:exonuclease III